ncbi:ATP-binding protein [Erwinia mallotivora]|uniref:ATP-binding protein n=1 Tax=Erwinia mallotivora TaxID=69222 RepID=UPI0035EFF828
MDPILNPYSPGAGHQPPELAGRDTLRQRINIAIARIKAGRAAKSILMIGLRGVGKTVLLEQMRKDAEAQGAQTLPCVLKLRNVAHFPLCLPPNFAFLFLN